VLDELGDDVGVGVQVVEQRLGGSLAAARPAAGAADRDAAATRAARTVLTEVPSCSALCLSAHPCW